MICSAGLLIFIPFLIEGITSTPTTNVSKYDLTNTINDVTFEILRSTRFESSKLMEKMNPPLPSYRYNANNTIFFNNLTISDGRSGYLIPDNIYVDFMENIMHIHHGEMQFAIKGDLVEPNETNVKFYGSIMYTNFSMEIRKLSKDQQHGDEKIKINISYDTLKTGDHGNQLKNCDNISYECQLNLIHVIGKMMPSIVLDRIFNNSNLSTYLEENYFHDPKQKIASACPDFHHNEHKYYYFIPEIPLLNTKLKDVKIRGLANYESFWRYEWFVESPFRLHRMVQVKDIRASMKLDHGSNKVPFIKLKFIADELYILGNDDLNFIQVKAAGNYSIVQANLKSRVELSSWLNKYSQVIRENIEKAIARSIISSQKVRKNRRSSSSLRKHKMERGLLKVLKNFTIN